MKTLISTLVMGLISTVAVAKTTLPDETHALRVNGDTLLFASSQDACETAMVNYAKMDNVFYLSCEVK